MPFPCGREVITKSPDYLPDALEMLDLRKNQFKNTGAAAACTKLKLPNLGDNKTGTYLHVLARAGRATYKNKLEAIPDEIGTVRH